MFSQPYANGPGLAKVKHNIEYIESYYLKIIVLAWWLTGSLSTPSVEKKSLTPHHPKVRGRNRSYGELKTFLKVVQIFGWFYNRQRR